MRDEKGVERKTPPKTTKGFSLESPQYEDQLDPFFADPIQQPADQEIDMPSDEEDWYWREPDNYWLEEGMWPWPEPRAKRRAEETPPDDTQEPPVI